MPFLNYSNLFLLLLFTLILNKLLKTFTAIPTRGLKTNPHARALKRIYVKFLGLYFYSNSFIFSRERKPLLSDSIFDLS
jgi:hypothetical protein